MVSNAYAARKYSMSPFDALLVTIVVVSLRFRNELTEWSQSYDPKGSQIILSKFFGSKSNGAKRQKETKNVL